MNPFPKALTLLGILAMCGSAAVDSSEVLFQDSPVRNYRLDFYGDTAWATKLEAMWKADSGYLPARFFDGQTTLDSVGVRYKGNSSFTLAGNNPKKPFKIKFGEFKTQTYYGQKILNFSNGIGDPTFLREKISYDISRHYLPTPRANFATIAVGTDTIGLYTQVEQADKTYLKRWFAIASGNLFKAGDDGAPLKWLGTDTSLYGAYELKTNEDLNDHTGLLEFIAALDKDSGKAFCEEHAKWIDLDNVGKFLAFNMVLSNFDSYTGSGRNYYIYQETDSSATQLLPWDVNLSFGAYSNGWNVLTQDLLTVSNIADRPLLRQVAGCETLRIRYLQWVARMVAEYASTDSIEAAIARLAPVIRPSVTADANKFFTTAAFESNLTTNLKPTPSTSIPGLVAFSEARNASLATQLTNYLPGYTNTSVRPSVKSGSNLALTRAGRDWTLSGLSSMGGTCRIDILAPSGKLLATFAGVSGDLTMRLPSGPLFVRIAGSRSTQTLAIANF